MSNLSGLFEFLQQQKEVKSVSASSGTVICNTGDKCQNLIILQEGQVRVSYPAADGRSITLYQVGAGESCILTASCIISPRTFPAIAKVEQKATGLAIPSEQVRSWLQTEPVWQQHLFDLLSQRMVDLISLVDALAFRHLDVRLANWLLKKSGPKKIIHTTHQAIAEELASTREVISRLLKEFERDGLVKLTRGLIEVVDQDKMRIQTN